MESILQRIQRCSEISTTLFLIMMEAEGQILTSFLRISAHMQRLRERLMKDTEIRTAGLRLL